MVPVYALFFDCMLRRSAILWLSSTLRFLTFLSIASVATAYQVLAESSESESSKPFRVEVLDRDSRWPVPLVELRTTSGIRFVSDNAGVIAVDAPELWNRETWFHVEGHGYEVPADGFGYQGMRMTPRPGAAMTLFVDRKSIVKRIGRLTGSGLFAESQKLGERLDWKETPIVGCDSVQLVRKGDRYFWNWGDTSIREYPLGIFDMLGASTNNAPYQKLEPPLQPRYDYFLKPDGKLQPMAPIPGPGPTWLTGYAVVKDSRGTEHLVATYMKIKPPLEVYELGLCEWEESSKQFKAVRKLWEHGDGDLEQVRYPKGHSTLWKDKEGKDWMLVGDPLPTLRYPLSYEGWLDHSHYESIPVQAKITARDGDREIIPHSGSIAFSKFRNRWITIFVEKFGSPSAFGELWFAEAESPMGEWKKGVKILSHRNYTFYNPRLHAEFLEDHPQSIFFEGTYTREFADHAIPTPRFDYNQMLYRLDLDDPKL